MVGYRLGIKTTKNWLIKNCCLGVLLPEEIKDHGQFTTWLKNQIHRMSIGS
jgi:hypothetical protein